MDEKHALKAEVDRLILEKIDSVPHLEALLLLWNTRPKRWTPEDIARRLYIRDEVATQILQDLVRHELIALLTTSPAEYGCEIISDARARVLDALDETYRQDLIRISTAIHSKAPKSVQEFARAFRFTKERE
jgi:DNA-binding MarR family transcriptional regulator